METYERLREMVEKSRLTKEDKVFIEPLAKQHDISLNKRCPDCWKDAAIQLALLYKPKEEGKSAGGYVLRKGIDVTLYSYRYGTFRVCEATLTKENAEKWIAAGIPLRYFEKTPEDAGNEQH